MTDQERLTVIRGKLKSRYKKERLFQLVGKVAIFSALAMLVILFITIFGNGYSAFLQTFVQIEVSFDADIIAPNGSKDSDTFANADYGALVKKSLRNMFPDVTNRSSQRDLYAIVSSGANYKLSEMVSQNPAIIGTTQTVWVPANDDVDMYVKGYFKGSENNGGRLKENQTQWIDKLIEQGSIKKQFNRTFFISGDSRSPELAGIWGALVGSFYTMLVTLMLSFPLGVATAVYLEEFAPTNLWTDIIEVNINNLAAVPSIVFGLLGLAVFLNLGGLPRSAPIVGGLVLTLMTLPTIIIASRSALKAVPPSIREAALGIGASKMQSVFHHVLPLAMPGMMTGAIIGMARALGETAPLLMIGMVAFIVDIPGSVFEPSTVLPVQIYLWADSPERAFVEKTSAAIMVLLAFLIVMNALAVILRKKFEKRW
ncbi:phosphate ABC transporter, permease protein PstA [Candidatus Magnetoovum chiemensis]|nr:phosphate ABC transporter, permease protein PstA [Candidatus Magnetoovum chiemensis]